jgi:hypothetical protein
MTVSKTLFRERPYAICKTGALFVVTLIRTILFRIPSYLFMQLSHRKSDEATNTLLLSSNVARQWRVSDKATTQPGICIEEVERIKNSYR